MDEPTPVTPVLIEPKKTKFTDKKRLQQKQRRVRELVKNAPGVVEPTERSRRKCRGQAKVRDENDIPLKGEDGKFLRKPCGRWAIKGGFTCPKHGGSAPQVKRSAAKRLLSMVAPSLVELHELVIQNVHLPTKLGAIRTVIERAGDEAIGPLKKQVEEKDTRPRIYIGIKVGGIANPGGSLAVVGVRQIPAGKDDDAQEGVVVEDDSDTE